MTQFDLALETMISKFDVKITYLDETKTIKTLYSLAPKSLAFKDVFSSSPEYLYNQYTLISIKPIQKETPNETSVVDKTFAEIDNKFSVLDKESRDWIKQQIMNHLRNAYNRGITDSK